MRIAGTILAAVLALPISSSADGPGSSQAGVEDVWATNTSQSLVVQGTAARQPLQPNDDRVDQDPTPEQDNKACKTDTVLQRSCGMYAVRVTEDESGRPVTIEDLAQFSPAPVTTTAEPGNVGVVGKPTNFVAAVSAHTRTGTLLGRPVAVRFTPVRVTFDHGDGTSATSADGGRTWSALGQASFTPTPTSHTYTERGSYTTRTTVHYTAEVDVGGGWFSVAGELAVDGAPRQIRIYEATTALVARTCVERPAAPGC